MKKELIFSYIHRMKQYNDARINEQNVDLKTARRGKSNEKDLDQMSESWEDSKETKSSKKTNILKFLRIQKTSILKKSTETIEDEKKEIDFYKYYGLYGTEDAGKIFVLDEEETKQEEDQDQRL